MLAQVCSRERVADAFAKKMSSEAYSKHRKALLNFAQKDFSPAELAVGLAR